MKLWVRSSDKMQLTEINNLSFKQIINGCWNINGNYGAVSLGSYPTRERCLEIIDEIQKLLGVADPTKAFLNIECDELLDYIEVKEIIKMARTEKVGYVPNGKVELIMPNVITYQMPEE